MATPDSTLPPEACNPIPARDFREMGEHRHVAITVSAASDFGAVRIDVTSPGAEPRHLLLTTEAATDLVLRVVGAVVALRREAGR